MEFFYNIKNKILQSINTTLQNIVIELHNDEINASSTLEWRKIKRRRLTAEKILSWFKKWTNNP